MRIITGYPPNFAELRKAFKIAGNRFVVFSYGDTIYSPQGPKLHRAIIAHEEAHGRRQLAIGVTTWWDRYIAEIPFRFEEELIGHRAEWQAFKNDVPFPSVTMQRKYLDFVSKRLSGELYGGIVGYEQAMREITAP